MLIEVIRNWDRYTSRIGDRGEERRELIEWKRSGERAALGSG